LDSYLTKQPGGMKRFDHSTLELCLCDEHNNKIYGATTTPSTGHTTQKVSCATLTHIAWPTGSWAGPCGGDKDGVSTVSMAEHGGRTA
jgi:hypothetical protein